MIFICILLIQKPGKYFGNNILAILNSEKEVLLIDTGYENQGFKVFNDLKSENLTVKRVIISHFHDL
ncbi:MAG: MBL fold metallo-hydrolase [Firmicutes bacterium]|nr:MBL fold metallo-hydrolase [Bacillota bacterium]